MKKILLIFLLIVCGVFAQQDELSEFRLDATINWTLDGEPTDQFLVFLQDLNAGQIQGFTTPEYSYTFRSLPVGQYRASVVNVYQGARSEFSNVIDFEVKFPPGMAQDFVTVEIVVDGEKILTVRGVIVE